MTSAQYHADPCPEPSLSASLAKVLLERSPEHAWLAHPRLGGRAPEPSPTMDFGSLVHAIAFGLAAERIAVADFASWRGNEPATFRELAAQDGKLPVLRHEFQAAALVARSMEQRLATFGMPEAFRAGTIEGVYRWIEPAGAGPIWCRSMIDNVIVAGDRATIYDLKTTRSAHPEACRAQVVRMLYDLQAAFYRRAVEVEHPAAHGRVRVVFVFVEVEPPYAVTPVELAGDWPAVGESRRLRAIEIFSRCLHAGAWPGYTSALVQLEPPEWLLTKEFGEDSELTGTTPGEDPGPVTEGGGRRGDSDLD